MIKQFSFFFLSIGILFLSTSFSPSAKIENATIKIKVTNIRSTKGNLLMGFYKDNKSFSKREPFMGKTVEKTDIKDGVVTFQVILPAGTYGIALLDDENKNGKTDYGFLLPVEGFGFSNYYHKGITAPGFTDFDFTLGSSDKEVTIKVKYM